MNRGIFLAATAVAAAVTCAPAAADEHEVKHVLVISVDGLHAVDAERFIASHPESALAELAEHGVRYTTAATSRPSDSFPGVLSILTGGSPASADVFYDVSWDRTQWPPGPAGCTGAQGQQTTYDETIDLLIVNGAGQAIDQNRINPDLLPWGIKDGSCQHIYPHDFVKVNTIFDVVKRAGGRTAWADKHAAYDLVTGPTGKAVDDLYTPEVTNPQTLTDSSNNTIAGPYDGDYGIVVDSGGTHVTPDATVSVNCALDNDRRKFKALVAEINGYNHTGMGPQVGTPTVFGTDLQAISVGQKVSHNNFDGSCYAPDPAGLDGPTPHVPLTGKLGGYKDGSGTPTDVLKYALEQTDAQLALVVAALKGRHIFDSTIIIISAKHGQTPIDPHKTNKIGHLQDLVKAYAPTDPTALAIINAGENEDDVALIWLQDQSQAAAAAQWLRDNNVLAGLHIQQVLSGDLLKLRFRDPTTDNHTPDIIVVPELGTIYTGSLNKNAEHGGFSNDDTNVALIASQPGLASKVIKGAVLTTQIAPTILRALNLDPNELKAVQIEHTEVLPGLGF